MENSVEGINIRLDQAEERISELEDSSFEMINSEEWEEKDEEKWKKPKDLGTPSNSPMYAVWDSLKRRQR